MCLIQNLDAATPFELGNDNFKKGWARRKVLDGGLYGRKFIKDYKDDVAEYFERGIIDKSDKNEQIGRASCRERVC